MKRILCTAMGIGAMLASTSALAKATYFCRSTEAPEFFAAIDIEPNERDALVQKTATSANVVVTYKLTGASRREQVPLSAQYQSVPNGREFLHVALKADNATLTGFMTEPGVWKGWAGRGDTWFPVRCNEIK